MSVARKYIPDQDIHIAIRAMFPLAFAIAGFLLHAEMLLIWPFQS